jgi:serpin B
MKKTRFTFKLVSMAVLLAILLSACGSSSVNVAKSSLQRVASPNIQIADSQTLVEGNNAFALDIYKTLQSQDGNLILSPFSISLALAMTYAGARGTTESQMADVLHFNLPQGGLHPAFNALDQELASRGKPASEEETPLQLNIANSVWAEQTFPFLQEYLDVIALNYGAGIQLADFLSEHEAVRKQINDWVSDQTEDKINDLLQPGILNPSTKMVLVNAIYFKADWMVKFDPDLTRDAPFHLLDGSEVQADMMSKTMYGLPYTSGDGFQAVELAYQGGTAAMNIIVPDEGKFVEFESALDAARLNEILGNMQPSPVHLSMPKFDFTSEFNLSDQLKGMGMPDAFDENLADFSGMTGGRDVFIDNVIHKAFVAVDEDGTEAAAATAVIIAPTSAGPIEAITLVIDRPFIFLIRDIPSGQILFIGRVLDPME